jgi:outer membrane protein assembly factor BamB
MRNKNIILIFIIFLIILYFSFNESTNSKMELKYRGNILRNGIVYTKEIIKKPEIKWIYNSKEDISFYYPIIYNDILLVGFTNYSKEIKERGIKAIDTKNGKLIWELNKLGSGICPLEVSNNILIISTRDLKLYAINVSNGKILWQIDRIEGSFSESVPTIYNNIVYLGSTLESEFEEDYIHFCGYDLYTGKIVWEYQIYGSNTAPIIDNGKLYINDGWYMLCIDIKTRKLIWKYNCKGWIAVDAVLSENILLVCDTKEGLKALDKNTGKVIWRNENYIFDRAINYEPPVVVKDKIYFQYYDRINSEEYLCCININNGKLIWKKNVKELGCRFVSMLVVDKYIYATSFPLNIVCFDTETNSILWRYDFPIPKNQKDWESGRIVIYDSKIYIATSKGKIYCME